MTESSKFGTIEKDPISKQIAARLLSLLKEKHLNPGDKLPPERELAAMMQVSRPSLREALQALSMMNVLEIRQGSGTYVTSLEPELLSEQLSFVFALDDSTFLQLFEARKILETGIIGLAVSRITDDDIADLKQNLAKAEEVVANPEAFLQIDVELHKKIFEIAQNPILTRMYDSISQLNWASRSRTGESAAVRKQAIKDHYKIVAALEARDAEAAQQAMLQHLSNVEARLKALISAESATEQ